MTIIFFTVLKSGSHPASSFSTATSIVPFLTSEASLSVTSTTVEPSGALHSVSISPYQAPINCAPFGRQYFAPSATMSLLAFPLSV